MRALVVENHPIVRLGLVTALRLEENVEVVGEAEGAAEALRLAGELEPDLAVVDLRLRGGESGVDLCRELKSLPVLPYVLIYTAFNSREEVQSCLLAGADSFVHKEEGLARLREAVKETNAGKRVWLLGGEEKRTGPSPEADLEVARLTRREKEVLSLLFENESNARIADELHLTVPTVKTHVSHIFKKLGVSGREELPRKKPL